MHRLDTSEAHRPLAADDISGLDHPVLRWAESLLNLHPLNQVIPVDWAQIARALRTVTLGAMRRPDRTVLHLAEFNLNVWQAAVDIWSDTARRWLGVAAEPPKAVTREDKRFAAPEWHDIPTFRSLKELYLLGTDRLLRLADDVDGLTPAARQHLDFHLRQFVDASSPALFLATNPVALRRAFETDGASLADGWRNLLDDLRQGRLSMVDATAFEPGAEPGTFAGQGRAPQQADRADPVCTRDRRGASRAPADRSAVDQQVLYPRLAATEQHGEVPDRAGVHRVHGVLAQSRCEHARDNDRGIPRAWFAGGQRGSAGDHAKSGS